MGTLQSALLACLPLLIASTPMTTSLWSWLIGGGLLGFVFCGPIWGKLTDRYTPARTLTWTFAGLTTSHLLLLAAVTIAIIKPTAFWPILGGLILSRLVYSLFASGLFGAAQASVITPYLNNTRSHLARLNAANQAGRLLGPLLVALCAWYHALLSLYLLGVICILVSWSLLYRTHYLYRTNERSRMNSPCQAKDLALETDSEQQLSGNTNKQHNVNNERIDWRKMLPELSMALCLTFFLGTIQFVLGPYLQHQYGLSPEEATQQLSLMLAMSALSMVVTALVLIPKLQDHAKSYLIMMLLTVCVGSILLGSSDSIAILLTGLILACVGVALITPYYGQQLRDRWPLRQGLIGGILTSAHTIGYGVGTLAGGLLFQYFPDYALRISMLLGPTILVLTLWQCSKNSISPLPEARQKQYTIANVNDCDLN
ncbi:MFS transporter [Hahella ganghwensis]|uniref:MFS transporter n=1 Tax=Hahella ganghwensis TaxID=286420 RepID=UPI001461655E|nr:MFS transporter [Hahella ganghwensis]